jgi:hypothetical protein
MIAHQQETTIQSGNIALKACLILNGGACIALLSFCASIANQARKGDAVRQFFELATHSLKIFAITALFSAVAAGLGYIGNYCASEAVAAKEYGFEYPFVRDTDASARWRCRFDVVLVATVGMTVASYLLFAWGLWQSASWIEA